MKTTKSDCYAKLSTKQGNKIVSMTDSSSGGHREARLLTLSLSWCTSFNGRREVKFKCMYVEKC